MLGLNSADGDGVQKALATKDGAQYHAEDLSQARVETDQGLVYSAAIRENSDNYGRVIGAMGVYFDFQGEAQMILDDHMARDADDHGGRGADRRRLAVGVGGDRTGRLGAPGL